MSHVFWLSRPRFWLYLAGPLLVGVVYGAGSPEELLGALPVALFLYFLLPANVFLYGINDVFDADIDRRNPKKGEAGREVRYTGDRWVPLLVAVSGLLGLAFLPLLEFPGRIAFGGFLILGTAYSVPPVRLKTTPFLDSASNGLYVLPGVVGYAAVAGSVPPLLAIAGGWVWAMGMHTFSAIPDIDPDRAAGIRTMATVLGESRTLAYCAVCWLLAATLMGLVHPGLGVLFAAYPVGVAVVWALDVDISRAYWWFPLANAVAGALLTMGGLWVLLHG